MKSDNIAFLSLVHLLTKKKILSTDEAMELRGISYLKGLLEAKGILGRLDLESMESVYSEIVKLVRGYLSAGEDKEKRGEILSNLEKVLSEGL